MKLMMKQARLWGVVLIFVGCWLQVNATFFDGTSSVKYYAQPVFLHDQDAVAGFVRFARGIKVLPEASHSAEIFLNTCAPLAGGFDLLGTNILTLVTDVRLDSTFTFTNGGKLNGYGKTLHLGGDITLDPGVALHVGGKLTIDGHGHSIFVNERSTIMLDNEIPSVAQPDLYTSLTICNATIYTKRMSAGLPALTMTSSLCHLTLSDVELALDSDFYVNAGRLFVDGDVAVTGTSALVWRSIAPCEIDSHARLYFDIGTTFSFCPPAASTFAGDANRLVRMHDKTSTLFLNGATLQTTHTGMRLTTGQLWLDNAVNLKSMSGKLLAPLGSMIGVDYGNAIYSVSWSPDGRYLAVGGYAPIGGHELQLYRFDGSTLTAVTSQDYGRFIYSVSWSPDGRYLAVGGNEPVSGAGGFNNTDELRIYRFDGSSLTAVTSRDYGDYLRSVSWSPDGRYLAVGGSGPTSGNELQLYRFDGNTLTAVTSRDFGSYLFSVSWSPDGRYLAVGGNEPVSGAGGFNNTDELRIYRFDGSSLTAVTSRDYGSSIYSVSWSPDGRYLAVGGHGPIGGHELQLYRFDGSTLTAVTSRDFGSYLYSVAWSSDGRYLAVGGEYPASGNELHVYRFDGSSLTAVTSRDYGISVRSVSWSPDGRYLAVGGHGPIGGHELQVYPCFYGPETETQALSNSIVFGDAAAGAVADLEVNLLGGARVLVEGNINYDGVS